MDFQNDFSIEEFASRRQRLAVSLDAGSVALIPGAGAMMGSQKFRQFNDFYYLCGVEVPHAYLLITAEGRATIFLTENQNMPFSLANQQWIRQVTGLDSVQSVSSMARGLQSHKVVYLPSREGEGSRMSWDNLLAWRQAMVNDPYDGRVGRNSQVAVKLQQQFPLMELRDLSAIIDEMRLIKSPAELVLMRRAGELTGNGALAAMRVTKPGIMEYQLHAELEHVYLKGGAVGDAYCPIIPGQANAGDSHYMANDCSLDDGDIVLVDCAPDYRYYTSDIGRMWPINGKFSEEQRALYGYVVEYHKAVLSHIRPGVMRSDVHEKSADMMRPLFDSWSFISEEQRETARILFSFTGHISHGVGMAVHDVSQHYDRPFEEGMVFAVDPMAWDDKHETYYRVEDTVVVTEGGYENLTKSCPFEIDDIEVAMS